MDPPAPSPDDVTARMSHDVTCATGEQSHSSIEETQGAQVMHGIQNLHLGIIQLFFLIIL